MDAFDEGIVTTTNFAQARKIVTSRARDNKKKDSSKNYTVGQLKQDIAEVTREKTSYVRESQNQGEPLYDLIERDQPHSGRTRISWQFFVTRILPIARNWRATSTTIRQPGSNV